MEFCEVCQNMLYYKHDVENSKLMMECKRCSFSKDAAGGALRVSETLYSEDDLLYRQHINQYLRYDPTLPRMPSNSGVVCPDKECPTKTQNLPQSVIYVKYHPIDMKYLYVCEHCGYTDRIEKFRPTTA